MAILGAMIQKESLHIVRDWRTLTITLLMPLVLLLLFGFAISTEVRNIRICATVERYDDVSRKILSQIEANEYFDFQGLVSPEKVGQLLQDGKTDAVLSLKASQNDTPEKMQIIVDASNTVMAQAAVGYIQGATADEKHQLNIITSTLYNPQLKSAYNFVPGIMGMIFILICAIMTSVSIVREKESGTLNLLIVSPIKASTIILGKLIPYLLLSGVILTIVLVLAYGVLGMPYTAISVCNAVLFSAIYIILALGIGLLISTVVRTQMAALIVSAMAFMLPVIMLSGMIFPIENLPEVLQWVSCAIPARWYISAMRKIMVQQAELSLLLQELTILAGTAVMLLSLAILNFRRTTR